MKKITLGLYFLAVSIALAMAALVWHLNTRDEPDLSSRVPVLNATPELLARGAYLARAGNCAACHTTRGGTPYAGGRGVDTPFGTVYSSNLTPEVRTGIGNWSAAEFWRALHNGRSKDGRLLYPAFPYASYTTVTRADSDALYAYLHSQPATVQPATPHALRWPFDQQAALAVWRALYFVPATFQSEPAQSAEWNRGAYLVRGLGHCAACHTARNALGATTDRLDLAGGLIPVQNWYAPSLTSSQETGMHDWPLEDAVHLLQTGVAPLGTVLGPMAEVVQQSTQYLSLQDLTAMVVYLKALPQTPVESARNVPNTPRNVERGAKLYDQHCVQCHGAQGQGVAGAYPALAGNRAVTLASTANLVHVVRQGGFAPATAGNPRPFGMPPFVLVLNDADIATVLTHIRASWGNHAAPVTELEVGRLR